MDVPAGDGRTLRAHDSGVLDGGAAAPALVWHHGSPQTGAPLEPLVRAAAQSGVRVVSCARPDHGGSSPSPRRDAAPTAGDVAAVADALGPGRFAVMGASGGGPHALARGALLRGRVTGVVSPAGPAPCVGDAAWSDGTVDASGLRSALAGRRARARHAETEHSDETSSTAADRAALAGPWASPGEDAGRAGRRPRPARGLRRSGRRRRGVRQPVGLRPGGGARAAAPGARRRGPGGAAHPLPRPGAQLPPG